MGFSGPTKRPNSNWMQVNFKAKQGMNSEVERLKARLVAKGHSQKYGVDYDETYAPVVRYSSIRVLHAFPVKNDMLVHQMDVVAAFLNGLLEEEIYMEQLLNYKIKCKEKSSFQTKKSQSMT